MGKTNRQVDRYRDGQTGMQTHRKTDRHGVDTQPGRHACGQTDRQTGRQASTQTDRHVIDQQTGKQTHGQTGME